MLFCHIWSHWLRRGFMNIGAPPPRWVWLYKNMDRKNAFVFYSGPIYSGKLIFGLASAQNNFVSIVKAKDRFGHYVPSVNDTVTKEKEIYFRQFSYHLCCMNELWRLISKGWFTLDAAVCIFCSGLGLCRDWKFPFSLCKQWNSLSCEWAFMPIFYLSCF